MKELNVKELQVLAAQIRLETLKVIHSRGFGHVGGSMDLADLMAVLYGAAMNYDPKDPRWPDRDWLVLSKGHAGPVAYATFGLVGFYPIEDAYTLNHPHTRFPSHTDRKLTPGVDLTTGSLGQGTSTATGAALGNRIDGRNNRVYQLDGTTAAILDHGDIAAKAASFGLYTQEIDGHDVAAIYHAIEKACAHKGSPSCIVLDTSKGKGATFAEVNHEHSSQPSEEQWTEAIAAAEKALAEIKQA